MELLLGTLLVLILGLLALVVVPSRVANRHVRSLRRIVTAVVGLEAAVAFVATILFLVGDAAVYTPIWWGGLTEAGAGLGLFYDGAASLMVLLVSFVGFIVSRFSIRYLDGEERQGRYFRWLGFTIGAVSLMVISGNLVLFFLALVMTSYGLHHLLLHYHERAGAQRAAWTKFVISRLGDVSLATALVLTYRSFGTFDFATLFAAASDLKATTDLTLSQQLIGWFLVLGAVTKSAQFPFHIWLPNTMETPTPVSALMHAGIVNAGGYIIIRTSPLVILAPAALTTLLLIGAFTACFAAIVMMTQPNIKRTLAYSTIAQMGFMMLQCGLGAFSAAMLHILAHSLYKAHSFLGSGGVIASSTATDGAKVPTQNAALNLTSFLLAIAVTVSGFAAISIAFGMDLMSKPGGIVLSSIFCVALATWGWQLVFARERLTLLTAVVGVLGLSLTYLGGYVAVDAVVASTLPVFLPSPLMQTVSILVLIGFAGLVLLHPVVLRSLPSGWLRGLQVHAANGFYIDLMIDRLLLKSPR